MRKLLSIGLWLTLAAPTGVRADLFVGPTTSTNRFVLLAGQAALISALYPENQLDNNLNPTNTVQPVASLVSGGETNAVMINELKPGLTALVGPAELVAGSALAISYKIITNSAFQCLLIKSKSTNTISVPVGKTIRFLTTGLDGYTQLIAGGDLAVNGRVFHGANIYGGAEFDGPLTITIPVPDLSQYSPPGAPLNYTLCYYICDQSVILPDKSVLQSATGNLEIQVQKSTDLQNWHPSIVLPTANDEKAFYRLGITK